MAQMGAGMAEVGANIGRTLQRGYESMGQGIAGGIKAVGDAYQEYKDDEAKFNATKKMYKAFGGSLDENTRKEIDGIFADTSMSVREKNALAPTLMQYLGASNQQQQALAKQKQELDARAGLQSNQIAAENWRELERIDAQSRAPYQRAEAESLYGNGGGSGGGGLFMPQSFTLGPSQQQAPQQPALPAQINTQFRRKGG